MKIVKQYWERFAKENDLSRDAPEAWMFGNGSKAMANELGQLVLEGKKTGTCSAKCMFDLEGDELPQIDEYEIVLDGDCNPLAIIQYTKVEVMPMKNVSEAFALSEGEGDLSYDYWYQEHERAFSEELNQHGLKFTPDLLVVCQNFKVVDTYRES